MKEIPMRFKTVIVNEDGSNLPVKGEYFCCRSGFKTVQILDNTLPFKSYQREVRWYLMPIDPGTLPVDNKSTVDRFIKPTDKQIVEIALLFNDGKLEESKLVDMISMSSFIIDRLYENGDITKKSSIEKE